MVEQLYTGCLAQGAYYIESNGEAAIIDPLREVQPYIDMAKNRGAKIKYVLETHFHADFVSGHIDLAKKTGAKIVYGPDANTKLDIHHAKDGEILELGNYKIQVFHTPGHTLESTCYLLIDDNDKKSAVFTGDTLFIGDVGRPDLAQKGDITEEDLAGMLFESLRNKIMTLPDSVTVYPGHGAGSACGKNMSDETISSIGEQKETNYALRANMSKDEFVKEVTDGLLPPPGYFPENVAMNKGGYKSIDDVLNGVSALKPHNFKQEVSRTFVIDGRSTEEFTKAHIPGSVFIGLDDNFAPWVGALVDGISTPITFIAPEGREEEMATRMARVGYDNLVGYLDGGIDSWKEAGFDTDSFDNISASEFANKYKEGNVIDVRKFSEYEISHIDGALNNPLDYLQENLNKISREGTNYIHCQGGYRSVIASSILKLNGINNIINVKDGFNGISETDVKLSTETPELA